MILGLLYKTKKKRALAVQLLTEAKRIIRSREPMLARIDAALADLADRLQRCLDHHFASDTSSVAPPEIPNPMEKRNLCCASLP